MRTDRQFANIKAQLTRLPRVGVIIAAVLLVLAVLMLLHSRSENVVSPIEILLGTPQGLSSDTKVFSQDGVTVYMPPGATELDGRISIATAQPDLTLVADDSGWIIPKVVRVEFWSLEGAPLRDISFSESLEICFDLTGEQWQGYSQTPQAYRIQHYAAQQSLPVWETLPLVTYPERFQLCGQTYKLSLFGLSIQVEAGIPITGFTTSMPPAALPSIQTSQRRDRNNSGGADTAQVIPTHPPPTQIPATQVPPADLPPTQPPAIQPQPTDPPPADPPKEEKNKEDKEPKDKSDKGKGNDEKGKDDKGKEKDKKEPGPSG